MTPAQPYPCAPWNLQGQAGISVFAVPLRHIPAAALAHIPPNHRPLQLGGWTLLAAGFFHYGPGSQLEYEEFLVACPVFSQGRLRVSVLQIWVSSAPAAAGGRDLWGIPKRLAAFTRRMGRGEVVSELGSGPLHAALTARIMPYGLPSLSLRFRTAQQLGGRTVIATNELAGRLRPARHTWDLFSAGPLAFLGGRRPLISLALNGLKVRFGVESAE